MSKINYHIRKHTNRIAMVDTVLTIVFYVTKLIYICWGISITSIESETIEYIEVGLIIYSFAITTLAILKIMFTISAKSLRCNGYNSKRNCNTSRFTIIDIVTTVIDSCINITHLIILLTLAFNSTSWEDYRRYLSTINISICYCNIIWASFMSLISIIARSSMCKRFDKRKNADNIPYEYIYSFELQPQ